MRKRWLIAAWLVAMLAGRHGLAAGYFDGALDGPPREPELLIAAESPFAESLDLLPAEWKDPVPFVLPAPVEEVLVPGSPEPAAPAGPKVWAGRVELGFNAAEGNTQQYTTRLGGKAVRTTPHSILTLDLRYNISDNNNIRTQHGALFDWRFEQPYPNSPWSDYVHGLVEYDEFRAFDVRVTADAGFAYNFFEAGTIKLQTRLGAGFSREYGIADAEYVPEASSGFTFEHQLTPWQKFQAKGDVYPDVRNFEQFRAQADAAWEVKVDPQGQLSLRLHMLDRYDSTPSGKKRNDITYGMDLVWEF